MFVTVFSDVDVISKSYSFWDVHVFEKINSNEKQIGQAQFVHTNQQFQENVTCDCILSSSFGAHILCFKYLSFLSRIMQFLCLKLTFYKINDCQVGDLFYYTTALKNVCLFEVF